MNCYAETYDYELIYDLIKADWKKWAAMTGAKRFVIGISGGKDSTVCAALAVKIFGKENVIGVIMPNGEQSDIDDAYNVVNTLHIDYFEINIRDAYDSILKVIPNPSEQTKVNLPARLRMSTLFAVAQTYGARVIRTCNMSEDYVGYSTLFGDDCGAYQPLKSLTATEVMYLGEWLGLPKILAFKAPSDGLCGKTDEDRFGFTYNTLDMYIRNASLPMNDTLDKIYDMHDNSRFKDDIIQVPGPDLNDLLTFE